MSFSGNRYIVSFIDLYSGWPESFPVARKDGDGDTNAHLLLDEIYSRFAAPLMILTDNGSEYCNSVVKETLEAMNITHITSTPYHPMSNGSIDKVQGILKSILAKYVRDTPEKWDLYINQALAAIRFSINTSLNTSPFYALYLRDPVVPVDNILQPRTNIWAISITSKHLNASTRALLWYTDICNVHVHVRNMTRTAKL